MTFTNADNGLEEVRDVLRNTLGDKGIANKNEAWRLGVSDAMVSLYTKPGSEKNIPLGLAPKSHAADELAMWLANKCGGFFIKICGHLDGDTCNEQCDVLKGMAELQIETDPAKINRIWLAMQTAINRAVAERMEMR